MHIRRICIYMVFLHCVFSNVSSNDLHQRMHSHTGYIYLTFLHCAFSNASSNRLHDTTHSHTGCICVTFLHCALSNVSSNRLPEKRHSHIGCICLTFLHCALSNVFSNGLHENMHSCIGSIGLILWYCWSLSSRFSCLNPSNQCQNCQESVPLPCSVVRYPNDCLKLRQIFHWKTSIIIELSVFNSYFHFLKQACKPQSWKLCPLTKGNRQKKTVILRSGWP